MRKILVTGAGGFIGSWLVKRLKAEGNWVRGVDIKRPEYDLTAADEFFMLDLRNVHNCHEALFAGFDDVYQLAADMGGIGYITAHLADIFRNNMLINLNMLEAARLANVNKTVRYLYTSSACVYAQAKQLIPDSRPLKEEDAYPADPEPGYGWEKLSAEQACEYFAKDYGLDIRIVRFHNVYGTLGTWDGGREKSPAAICRKIAIASNKGPIEVWGDGEQTRSYMYIDDCIEGLRRIMESGYTKPLNLGTEEMLTVNQQVDITCCVAGKTVHKHHDLAKPQGVRGRNSDNSQLRKVLSGWEPKISFEEGIARTYPWIREQVDAKRKS